MSALHTEREQELFAARLLAKPEWTYPEALLWVLFRDGRTVAESLHYGSSGLLFDSASTVETAVRLMAEGPEAVELAPVAALNVALITGDVGALADFPKGRNEGPPWKISANEWQYLEFRQVRGFRGSGTVVDTRRWQPGLSDHFYINVRFVRADVMRAFEACAPAPRLARAPQPWDPNGRPPKQWVADPRVIAEAARRCGASDDNPAKRSEWTGALVAMWNEAEPDKQRAADTFRKDMDELDTWPATLVEGKRERKA